MLEMNASFFAVTGAAVLFAGVSKGGFGSGAAFASSAILALFLPPGLALGIMLPLLMLIDLATLGPYWKTWHWPTARLLVLGAVPGVVLGAAIYRLAPPDLIRLLIGTIALSFVSWQVAQRSGWIKLRAQKLPAGAGVGAGAVAGFTSFVSHAGGPPVAVFLLSQRLEKTQFQGTTVLVFWAINACKFVPYAFLGLFTKQTALVDIALAPFALLGTWLGVLAHRWVSERLFFSLTYVMLTLAGLKLIWEGLT
ncbi:hypothetical protein CVM52_16460 [Pseudooceanicola lipolyticus]|uniref:Probable membrane transporter protein n=1 Tax=Pseudooceanicola lipolyticus TaxID=2029104 RepID=A0A2M8IYG1_9RHOB|nr:sulfite exporter TauE/SafE family protein [Pseudooceanicola lipolyticus]PJE35576.1 hypothetical protein CVM52_16460 [Pseudooceanicola lipolyticus]